MQTRFWKLSHGSKEFTAQELLQSIEQRLGYIHGNTRAKGGASISQAEDFINNALIGDYFYLTYGNRGIYIIGQLAGPPNWCPSSVTVGLIAPFASSARPPRSRPYSGPGTERPLHLHPGS